MLGLAKAPTISKCRVRPPTLKLPTTNAVEEPRTSSSVSLRRVLPNLYISGYEATKDHISLSAQGITHILNLAGEHKCPNAHPGQFSYFSLTMPDNSRIDILFFIYVAVEFILRATQNGGKVLIHCVKGLSRAPTVACGYLILQHKLDANQSLAMLHRMHPEADPNLGFLSQLQVLCQNSSEERKEGKRLYLYSSKHDMMCRLSSFQGIEGNSLLFVDNSRAVLMLTTSCQVPERASALQCLSCLHRFEKELQIRVVENCEDLKRVCEEMQISLS